MKKTETKTYRIIKNFVHPKIKVTYGVGEQVPVDLTEPELNLLISRGCICPVADDGENVMIQYKDQQGRFILSDQEILSLKPSPKTLNFLKRNKISKPSLIKLKEMFDEATIKYKIPDNYFISEIFKEINGQLVEVKDE